MHMINAMAAVNEVDQRELGSAAMVTEDSDLVRCCQDGDHAAFQELVERYKHKTYWIAYDIVSHRETARDISQEAFIKAFTAIGGFNPRNSFEGWMRRIVTNLAIDELRSRARRKDVSLDVLTSETEMPSRVRTPAKQAETEEQRELVLKILDKLPPKYRTILALREIQGMSYEDIAKIIRRPAATVRWRIHHARKLFKEIWQRHVERSGAKEVVQ